MVLTTLLCGLETWVTFRSYIRLLNRWSFFVTSVEIHEHAEVHTIDVAPLKYQLRWAEHVSRNEDHRLPNIALYGELSIGRRKRRAPKKRYEDCLKKSLTARHVDPLFCRNMAADHDGWRHSIFEVVDENYQDRRSAQKDNGSKEKA